MADYEHRPDDMQNNAQSGVDDIQQAASSNADADSANNVASEDNYTYIQEGTPDGREYVTPEGSHGYVYTPERGIKCQGVGRKVLIAIGILGAVILAVGCCFLGTVLMLGEEDINSNYGDEGNLTYEAPGTTDGLVIVDEEDAQATETQMMEGVTTQTETKSDVATDSFGGVEDQTRIILQEETQIPAQTTTQAVREEITKELITDAEDAGVVYEVYKNIYKKQPLREDEDKNGKADIVFGEDGNVLTSADDRAYTSATVVAKVADSVVEITAEAHQNGQLVASSAGSGVVISKDGYVVTNHHVVAGADTICVTLESGKKFDATLVGMDEATDVAVLLIDPQQTELTVATLGSSFDLMVGEEILTIGNPLGSLGGTVTEGIISSIQRRINVDGNIMTLLQVSAPINPGNSGGGLFNRAGELVGIVNAKVSSENVEGLGFAIPIDEAYDVICELIEYGYVRGRASLGVTFVDVTDRTTAMIQFGSRYTGVYVYISSRSELEKGDRVVSVNGIEITSSTDIKTIINQKQVGEVLTFVVYRENTQETIELELIEYIPEYITA